MKIKVRPGEMITINGMCCVTEVELNIDKALNDKEYLSAVIHELGEAVVTRNCWLYKDIGHTAFQCLLDTISDSLYTLGVRLKKKEFELEWND